MKAVIEGGENGDLLKKDPSFLEESNVGGGLRSIALK